MTSADPAYDAGLLMWTAQNTGHLQSASVIVSFEKELHDPQKLERMLSRNGWRVSVLPISKEIHMYRRNRVTVGNVMAAVTLHYHF